MIRSFENRDALNLHQIWLAHHSGLGAPHRPLPLVQADHLQQAILSRPSFDPARLLVACDDSGTLLGWAHCAAHTEGNQLIALAMSPQFGSIVALETARQLIGEMSQRFGELTLWGNPCDTSHGYAGLEPVGWGIGIPSEDKTVTQLANEMGYRVNQTFLRLILRLRNFRMPVNRQFLQWRRTSKTVFQWTLSGSPRTDAAMSHLDRNLISVTSGGQTLASLVIWTSDREAAVMPPSHALFDLNLFVKQTEPIMDEAFQFSVASAAVSLTEQGLQTIEVVVSDTQLEWLTSLQTIGFVADAQGATYVR